MFTLPGKPQTYKPPRFNRKTGVVYGGHNSKMKAARTLLASAHNDTPLVGVPLVLEATAFFKRPKSHFGKY